MPGTATQDNLARITKVENSVERLLCAVDLSQSVSNLWHPSSHERHNSLDKTQVSSMDSIGVESWIVIRIPTEHSKGVKATGQSIRLRIDLTRVNVCGFWCHFEFEMKKRKSIFGFELEERKMVERQTEQDMTEELKQRLKRWMDRRWKAKKEEWVMK